MATATRRTIKRIEDTSGDIGNNIGAQIAALRREIAAISSAIEDFNGPSVGDLRHGAVELVDQVRHQGAVAARQIGRQANVAGQVVRENPIPVIVALGTIALISALIFTRDQRSSWYH
jgi:hypothetical protein